MKRYTSHQTAESGPHVWDHSAEESAMFATLREADYARDMLNGGIDRAAFAWVTELENRSQ